VAEELIISRGQWLGLLSELRRRGGGQTESGAFLLGRREGDRRIFQSAVFYDDLDPKAYSSGVCILYADAFERLWGLCRARGLQVLADVHTHPGNSLQSEADRRNPMVARPGHLALIVERFASDPVWRHRTGVYRYEGSHTWTNLSGWGARRILNTGTFA
jgi:proteasome lid subunit RPN8/RPN11